MIRKSSAYISFRCGRRSQWESPILAVKTLRKTLLDGDGRENGGKAWIGAHGLVQVEAEAR
jgi:hypothetical protein